MSVSSNGGLSSLLLFVATVAGSQVLACSGGGGATPSVPLSSAAAFAIAELWRRLDPNSRLGRHKQWFALRRAEKAAVDHPNWAAEADQLKIVQQVDTELGAVDLYVMKKLGLPTAPGPMFSYANDPTPHHLDLDDLAKIRTDSKPGEIAKAANEYRALRRERALSIIWRAAAVEPLVWKPAPAVALDEAVLDQLVDRRLRSIERMELNVNAGLDLTRTWKLDAPTGPWRDGFRVRMFEYGSVPKMPFVSVMPQPSFLDIGTAFWHELPHVRPSLNPYFKVDAMPNNIWIFYVAGSKQPHEVWATLFTPSTDFRQRAWFYCDHVLSAVLIEALWFGLHRKHGTDDAFNKLFDTPQYVYLGANVGGPRAPRNVLMDDEPNDPYFDNSAQPIETLQVGDGLVVWNHRLYDDLGVGAWRNEYSLVMEIDSDPTTGVNADRGLYLAGHGIATKVAPAVAADLADQLATLIDRARDAIQTAVAATPSVTEVDYRRPKQLVRWDPYGEFASDPPWWVRVPKDLWGTGPDGFGYANKTDALAGFARAIAVTDPAPSGYTAPSDVDAIYFPLYEPIFPDGGPGGDSWQAYLLSRASGERGLVFLRPLVADGRLTPGLFYRSGPTIPLIRPQAS